MTRKIHSLILLISIMLILIGCGQKSAKEIGDNYWQTEPRLAMVLNDNLYIKDVFHYEEISVDEERSATKKVCHNSDMKLLKNEIVVYRDTSDGKIIITVLDETYSTGFISKNIFNDNFSIEAKDMIELGSYAFVKSGTVIYNEQLNVERIVECNHFESFPVGKIIEKGDSYYKIAFNPDGEWQVLIKKEDLKYDGIFKLEITTFTL